MNFEDAAAKAYQYNISNPGFPIAVRRVYCFMAGIPVTIILFAVKGDFEVLPSPNFEDAVERREKILQKSLSKT